MDIDTPLRSELAGLREDASALTAGVDRPLPPRILAALLTRVADFRADLRAEFPTLFQARRPGGRQ